MALGAMPSRGRGVRPVDAGGKGLTVDALQRLNQMKMFDLMSDEERARWAERFRRQRYRAEEVVIQQGDRPTAFYIVDQGELYVHARVGGEEIPRAYLYSGDHFGEDGLLTGQPRNATVDVLLEAELLVLDRVDFDQLMEEYPAIRERLFALSRQREEAGRMRFDWQKADEVTIFFSNKHWMALVGALRLPIFLAVLGLVATFIYVSTALGNLPALFLMVGAGTSLAFSVLLFVYCVVDWRNDDYIITNRRVLHIERVLLLRESRDEAPIERVQDVLAKQEGVFANLLDFGDVIIQTAAATERIIFADVPQPKFVRDAIFAPMQVARTQERAEMRESIRQQLGQRLNISVPALGDRAESAQGEDLVSPAEERVGEVAEADFFALEGLSSAWRRLRGSFTFETRILSDGGETVTWRKTGWVLTKVSLTPGLAGLCIIVLFVWSVSQGVGLPTFPLALLAALMFIFGWWFYVYWDWQNDIYQISGDRLIDLKKRPLFLAEIRRETTLDRVENISLSIPGPVAQLLDYGTVVIETAGETGAFEFVYVKDPRSVQEEIFSRRERATRQRREAEKRQRQAELAEWFGVYEELKKMRTGSLEG